MLTTTRERSILAAAGAIAEHFRRAHEAEAEAGVTLAPRPDAGAVETLIDAGFWASLRREEGRSPQISLAFLPPDEVGATLRFARPLHLSPESLTHLAPAVERPGIHLGVWCGEEGWRIWGATREIPELCLVLEVVQPGVLVVKHRRGEEIGKFANVAVLQGDEVRLVDDGWAGADPIDTLLGGAAEAGGVDAGQVLVQLAVSMRAHGHGGTLLLVPHASNRWRDSIVQPVMYAIAPPFTRLGDLLEALGGDQTEISWKDHVRRAVDGVGGLTAVDGAAILSSRFDVLAFGAKIGRPADSAPVDRLVVTEPVVGAQPRWLHPAELGGTRHLSAAQFVHDQRDALALVASQDGRFTIFSWSDEHAAVRGHRVEVLLY